VSWIIATDAASWIALVVSAVALAWTVFANRRSDTLASESNAISRQALAIAEEERQVQADQRSARAELTVTVAPGGNHELDDLGTVWTNGSTVITTVVITIENRGERSAGRTIVEVWLPQAATGDAFWASGPGGPELPDVAKSTPDPGVLLSASATAPTFSAHYLSRTLDQIAVGVPERLYVRAPFAVDVAATYPIDVVVSAEGTVEPAKVRYLLNIKQRRS
jgi:hypothetical protein